MDELSAIGWVKTEDGTWRPAIDGSVTVVDSGPYPMLPLVLGGSMTIDIYKFWEFARRYSRPQPKHAKRDERIADLWNAGKTEGQILISIRAEYAGTTLSAVRSVLRRLRAIGRITSHPRLTRRRK